MFKRCEVEQFLSAADSSGNGMIDYRGENLPSSQPQVAIFAGFCSKLVGPEVECEGGAAQSRSSQE